MRCPKTEPKSPRPVKEKKPSPLAITIFPTAGHMTVFIMQGGNRALTTEEFMAVEAALRHVQTARYW